MKKIFLYILFLLVYFKSAAQNTYLHTDKDTYFSGEIMWFKMYADSSAVGYVQLLAPSGIKSLEAKIELNISNNGGSLYIPQGLKTGNYELFAYTLSTKEKPFSKKIRVINPFIEEEQSPKVPSKIQINLFPEGGHLVENLNSKVGVKLNNSNGSAFESSISVLENGNEIMKAQTNKNGLGYFDFTPLPGKKYTLKVGAEEKDFPKALETGLVLNLSDLGENYLANIKSTKSTFYPVEIKFGSKSIKINSDNSVQISKKDLPQGTSLISVVGADGNVLSERVVFRKPENLLNFSAKISKNNIKTRETLDLNLDTQLKDVSIAVRKVDDIQENPTIDIVSSLFLQNNLNGYIENPQQYFENLDTKALESLLLTHGWRRYKNSEFFEKRYHTLQIRYKDKTTQAPISNQDVLLSVPGKVASIFSSKTNNEGVATFFVKNIYGQKQLATKLVSGQASHIEVLEENFSPSLNHSFDYDLFSQKSFEDYAVNTQIENKFSAKERALFLQPMGIDSISFYGKADVSYKLDDYTRFVLMEEVLREYVKEVIVRKNRENAHFRVVDKIRNSYLNNEPLILLDGIPLKNTNEILNYDPLKVEKIDIVGSKFYFGDHTFDGIINFSTYKNSLENFDLDAAFSVFTYQGLQLEREFYVPSENLNKRTPDHRTVLYWNPALNLKQNEKLKILSSDINGSYLIDIQGRDAQGNVGYQIIKFEVK